MKSLTPYQYNTQFRRENAIYICVIKLAVIGKLNSKNIEEMLRERI
jgi:hypothetical protein